MKKQLYAFMAIPALAFLLFSGCSKDKTSTPAAKTNTELISQGSWTFQSASASGVDISSSVSACLKDNVVSFVSTGTGTVDEGATVCAPSYAGPFTWSFQSAEAILHLSAPIFPGGSNDFTLVSLTETNLVASQTMTIPPYPATNVVVTFKH